jgi:DNA (cytosine-5)-methyltransferase 1
VAGLFAGIGGIEQGLHEAGHRTELLCENDPVAVEVLRQRFPDTLVIGHVKELHQLSRSVDLLAGGFPCQDLSQAGLAAGIDGERSGLVDEVFRLLKPVPGPRWVLLENVPFMLQLERGRAMEYLTSRLEQLEYLWAYRVVDTRAFGLPQRRQRVLLLASRSHDPRPILFGQDVGEPSFGNWPQVACGFYWTEGLRGLGWAVDAIPTLKGGSTVGIPSAPAIWRTDGTIVTPDIRDLERLQGFDPDWTAVSVRMTKKRETSRGKLVGNAVSVPVARWLGRRLLSTDTYQADRERPAERGPWPPAAWGTRGHIVGVDVSMWPVNEPYQHLEQFIRYPAVPLSQKATAGFLERAERGTLNFHPAFLRAVKNHLAAVSRKTAIA